MKLLKQSLLFTCVSFLTLAAFADPATDDAKLTLLIADSSRLTAVDISAFDPAIKSEANQQLSEASISFIAVQVQGQSKTYSIRRDGGGQITSIQLVK